MTENSKKPAVSIDLFDDDEHQIINRLTEGGLPCAFPVSSCFL